MIRTNLFFLFYFLLCLTAGAQDCSTTRPLTASEQAFQSRVMDQLTNIFAQQIFEGYVVDEASNSYPPQVWTEVCRDRKMTEPFNLAAFYTYVLDPTLASNQLQLNAFNSIDYSRGEVALDQLRNLGNLVRLECEWGINMLSFTLQNVGQTIKAEVHGDVTIFRLENAYKEDSKPGDFRALTLLVKGPVEVVDETYEKDGRAIYKKTIRTQTKPTSFDSRLNAFMSVTGGNASIHQQLNISQITQQLNQLY